MADTPIAQSTIDAANAQPPVPASQPTDPGAAPDVLGGPSAASTAGGSLVQNPSAPSPPPSASQVLSGRQPSGFKAGLLSGLAGRQYTNDAQGNVVPKSVASGASGGLGTILGTLAMGALASLGGVQRGQRGAAAAGAGYRAANEQLQDQDATNRERAQQNFANQQKVKQEQREQVQAMDEHDRALGETVARNLNNHLTGLKINQLEANIPLENAELRTAYATQRLEASDLATRLFGPEKADWKSYADAQADPKTRTGLNNGTLINIPQYDNNGKYTGEKIYEKSMDNRPIDQPVTLPDRIQVVDGKLVKTPGQHFDAGTATNGHIRQLTDDVINENLKSQTALATLQKEKALAEEARAGGIEKISAANLNNAYARQTAGGTGSGASEPEQAKALQTAIANMSPAGQEALKSYSPGDQAMMIRGAHGFIDPNTFPQRLTKGGVGILRSQFEKAAIAINPNYSDSLYQAVKETREKYISGKEGQGIRSFNQFLVHSATAADISGEATRTNSPWINAPLNTLSSQAAGNPQIPRLMAAIEAARTEWQSFIDSGYKPDQDQSKRAAVLMSDKSSPAQIMGVLGVMGEQAVGRLDQLNESYRTAVGEDFPNLVTPSGKTAAQRLGLGDKVAKYQSGGNYASGNPQQNTPPPPAPSGKVVPAGGTPGLDVSGNVIGYKDQQGNWHPF